MSAKMHNLLLFLQIMLLTMLFSEALVQRRPASRAFLNDILRSHRAGRCTRHFLSRDDSRVTTERHAGIYTVVGRTIEAMQSS